MLEYALINKLSIFLLSTIISVELETFLTFSEIYFKFLNLVCLAFICCTETLEQ